MAELAGRVAAGRIVAEVRAVGVPLAHGRAIGHDRFFGFHSHVRAEAASALVVGGAIFQRLLSQHRRGIATAGQRRCPAGDAVDVQFFQLLPHRRRRALADLRRHEIDRVLGNPPRLIRVGGKSDKFTHAQIIRTGCASQSEWSIVHRFGYNRRASNRSFYGGNQTMQFERLGPYKIGKRLGRGGMGAVFEGVNVDTGESAAIKVLNPHLADDEGFRERFEMEIETLKKLKHPNIVRMYGYGEQDGYLYYAMELVNGRSVEEELQLGRRFSWREVVHYSVAAVQSAAACARSRRDSPRFEARQFIAHRIGGRNQADRFRHRAAVRQQSADDGRRLGGNGRIHVAGASQRRTRHAAERFVQPGGRDVRHAGRPAAVSHARP